MFLYNTIFERFNRNVILALGTQIFIDKADGLKFKYIICVKQTGGYKDH
jgi:hypothetical protein